MSKESTFIPLAFEWDREERSYKKAFSITNAEERTAATLIWNAKRADLNVTAQDVILDAISSGALSGNFAACMIQMGVDKWWEETAPGVYTILGGLQGNLPDEDES